MAIQGVAPYKINEALSSEVQKNAKGYTIQRVVNPEALPEEVRKAGAKMEDLLVQQGDKSLLVKAGNEQALHEALKNESKIDDLSQRLPAASY